MLPLASREGVCWCTAKSSGRVLLNPLGSSVRDRSWMVAACGLSCVGACLANGRTGPGLWFGNLFSSVSVTPARMFC